MSRNYLFPFYAGMVMPKGVRWRHLVEGVAGRIREAGIIDQLLRNDIPPRFLLKEKQESELTVTKILTDCATVYDNSTVL